MFCYCLNNDVQYTVVFYNDSHNEMVLSLLTNAWHYNKTLLLLWLCYIFISCFLVYFGHQEDKNWKSNLLSFII